MCAREADEEEALGLRTLGLHVILDLLIGFDECTMTKKDLWEPTVHPLAVT